MVKLLNCDYLVIGAGAASLAFIDTILIQEPSTKIVLVDKNSNPGGHWNHAYDYVHLHQPSLIYGLESRKLEGSWSKLLFRKLILPWKHRASKKEILTYFHDFVSSKISSGQVQYFPNCEYNFDQGHTFSSTDGKDTYKVEVQEKIVNGILGQCIVPSQNPVLFPVDKGVQLSTPNEIYRSFNESTKKSRRAELSQKKYVVLGAGKTAMDTVVYLQKIVKVKPANIFWVIPNDVWMISRESSGSPWSKAEVMLELDGDEEKTAEVLEKRGIITRLDKNVQPTKFRFPVIGKKELSYLRKIENLIRKGRVSSIHLDGREIVVDFEGSVHGSQSFSPADEYIFVHCTSPGPFNGAEIKELFVSDEELSLYLLFAPPISMSHSCLAYYESARKKGTLDIEMGKKLLMAMNNEQESGTEGEEKKEQEILVNDVLNAIVQPFIGSDSFSSLINLAVFLSVADSDPMVPYIWMKHNRLSFLSIPGFKCKIYESLDRMVEKGTLLGFSKERVEFIRLLRNKLEPLKGK